MSQDLNERRVGESLIAMGRELYRDRATNTNILPPYLLVQIRGVTKSSESEDLRDLEGV